MLYILLPAYNEAQSLPALLSKLAGTLGACGHEFQIVVCNDGSTDETEQVLDAYSLELPIKVLHHRINRGLGETSRDLFEYVAMNCGPDDIVIRMDCDDTHEPECIPLLISKLSEGADVVIASRFQPGGGQLGVSSYRAAISRAANLFMKCFFPIKGLKEYSCGFRAYRAGIIKTAVDFYGNDFIQLKGLGFTCTLEKLVKLKLLGARFAEVPFVLRYDQKRSASKMITSVTTLGYFSLAVCYHWPWGGWRWGYARKLRAYKHRTSSAPSSKTPDQASTVCSE